MGKVLKAGKRGSLESKGSGESGTRGWQEPDDGRPYQLELGVYPQGAGAPREVLKSVENLG